MAWRFKGRTEVDTDNPACFAICDRSGFRRNLKDLSWQMQWAGQALLNLRLLVRPESLDIPQEQLRTLILPPDPPPILNARPETFYIDETDFFTTEDLSATIITEDLSGDEPIVGEETPTPAPTWEPLDNFPQGPIPASAINVLDSKGANILVSGNQLIIA